MKLIYKVEDKPQFHQLVIFAFQQLLAIMAATIAVPLIIKNGIPLLLFLVPVLVPLFMLHLLVRRARYFWVLLLRLLVRCPLRLLVQLQ